MEFKIEKLDHYGRGICKIKNKITFVDNALPSEIVELEITNEKKSFNEAKVTKYIKKSEDRIEPFCKIDNCGCQLKYLSYKKQLQFKENKVKEIIDKFYKKTNINNIIASPKTTNYRNKITLKVNNDLGYYKTKSNELIKINSCLLANENINSVIIELLKLDLTGLEEIIIRGNKEIMVILKGKTKIKDIPDVNTIYINNKLIKGKGYIIEKINNLKFKIYKEAFFQVNSQVAELIYNNLLTFIKDNKIKDVVDLFCGTGTISLILGKCANVIGIDINQEAIKSAEENKKINNIKNVSFICDDANKQKIKADLIIVDPSRSGLTNEGINNILKIKPKHIIYVSCDPITLARDLKLLDNYNVTSITPYDMFPNTYHVETVSILHRKNI